jgi:hypothetical protein
MFQVMPVHTRATPPETYPPIAAPQGTVSPVATGVVGLAAGALLGAGYVASRKFSSTRGDEDVPGSEPPTEPPTVDNGQKTDSKGSE